MLDKNLVMKKNIAVTLSVVVFIVMMVMNVVYMSALAIDYSDVEQFLLKRLAPGVIVTVVLAVMMAREGRFSWSLLLLTLSTRGYGSIVYPLWLKKRDTSGAALFNRFMLWYAICMALDGVSQLIQAMQDWSDFIYQHYFPLAHLSGIFTWLMVILAVIHLCKMKCKHVVTWIFAIVMMRLYYYADVSLALLLVCALYDKERKYPAVLTKYWIVFLIQAVVIAIIDLSGGNSVVEKIIFAIVKIVVMLLLIMDTDNRQMEGRLGRILPVLLYPIFAVIAVFEDLVDTSEPAISEPPASQQEPLA